MKVIGAGFGRTGTLSLRAALRQLGFGPCHHMRDVTADPALENKWLHKAQGKNIAWPDILRGYTSIVDWPGCYYWEELLGRYPDAKAILTVRDPDAWYDSTAATLHALAQACGAGHQAGLSDLIIWQGTFSGRFTDRNHAISVFKEHIQRVIHTVSPERLLVYDISTGWGPLCQFLGVKMPLQASFPHINGRAGFHDAWHTTPMARPRQGPADTPAP